MPASDPGLHRAPPHDRPPRLPMPVPFVLLVAALLAAPVVGLLWVSSYARDEPRLFGFPFFYWYQLAWVFVAATTTTLAHRIVLRHERRREGGGDR